MMTPRKIKYNNNKNLKANETTEMPKNELLLFLGMAPNGLQARQEYTSKATRRESNNYQKLLKDNDNVFFIVFYGVPSALNPLVLFTFRFSNICWVKTTNDKRR